MKSSLGYKEIFFFDKVRPLIFIVAVALVGSAYLGQLLPKVVFDLSKSYGQGSAFVDALWDFFYLLVTVFGCALVFSLL